MKYRIVNRKRFITFTAALLLIIVFVSAPLVSRITASERIEKTYITVCVQEGDTLWQIAKEYGPKDEDIRKVIYDICRLNNMPSSIIYAGQTITVPCQM